MPPRVCVPGNTSVQILAMDFIETVTLTWVAQAIRNLLMDLEDTRHGSTTIAPNLTADTS